MNRTKNRFPRGMTLMEVLASIFVISIGLLGVLAVIPFGAYQVSKGRNAEHVANMLAAAGQDVQIGEFAKLGNWAKGDTLTPNAGDAIYTVASNAPDNPGNPVKQMKCDRFYMFDPFDTNASNPFNEDFECIYKVGLHVNNKEFWKEVLTGQDDLVYTVHKDKRTDFEGQRNRVASSGRYTWFFTFRPPDRKDGTNLLANGMVREKDLYDNIVTVDLLGCYNRVPGDKFSEREVAISGSDYTKTLHGAKMTLEGIDGDVNDAEELDLSKTKYIFVVLGNGASSHQFQYDGYWCKVVYAPKNLNDGSNSQKTIVVMNDMLPENLPDTRKAIIIDGVMYHKSVGPLSLFDPTP